MLSIKPVMSLFKPMISQRLSNFKYLTAKNIGFKIEQNDDDKNSIQPYQFIKFIESIKPIHQIQPNQLIQLVKSIHKIQPIQLIKFIESIKSNQPGFELTQRIQFNQPNGEKMRDLFSLKMRRSYAWLLPYMIDGVQFKHRSMCNNKNRMDKFVSEHKYQRIRKISDILENKDNKNDIIYTLIFSKEIVANQNQMIELLRLIKFNIYNEGKKLIICLDDYVLIYSGILSEHMNFEICCEKNQNNLYCQNNLYDIGIIIMCALELSFETSEDKRNNYNHEMLTNMYIKFIFSIKK